MITAQITRRAPVIMHKPGVEAILERAGGLRMRHSNFLASTAFQQSKVLQEIAKPP